MCKYTDYLDNTLTIGDLLDMHRSLNLKDHIDAQVHEASKPKG